MKPSLRFRQYAARAVLGCVAGAVFVESPALAADRSWSNTAGGTFNNVSNWQNGLFAGVNDVANFNNSSIFTPPGQASYTVTFNGNAQTQAVKVKNDFVTFNLNGNTYTTTQSTGNQVGSVGGSGTLLTARSARLTIQNGVFRFNAVVPEQMLVGAVPGGIGSFVIGNNGVVTGAPNLLVGTTSAIGSLIINGGTVTTNLLDIGSGTSGHGNAIVTGPFSSLTTASLSVANAGNGTLLIDIAATLTNTGTAVIAAAAGSSGIATVDGGNTRWFQQNGTLTVGAAGAGTLNIINGGRVTGTSAVMAEAAGSTATVHVEGPGSGSQWLNSGSLVVGLLGNATLNIASGGFVSCGSVTIGRGAGTSAALSISSSGSLSTAGRLIIGNQGTATVNVTGGGILNAGITVIANLGGGTSTLNISGAGSGATFGQLTIADVDSGTVSITNGARLTCNGDTDIGFGFENNGVGRVIVSGTGSRWINNGKITLYSGFGNSISVTGGGTVLCNGASIGGDAGLTVDGVGSRWTNNGSLTLDTNLNITNGAVVENTNSAQTSMVRNTSFALVQGTGSTWNNAGTLNVGGFDSRMSITSGGRVTAGSTFISDEGTVVISGNGANITTGRLAMGLAGTNSESITVSFGGSLNSQSAQLAGHNSSLSTSSSVTIRELNSTWQNSGSLIVAGEGAASFAGDAKLDVLTGATVTNGDAFIAFSPSSAGTVTVSGSVGSSPATWTTLGDLYIGGNAAGNGGQGELRILAGGRATISDTLTLRSSGVVNLNGGTLAVGSVVGSAGLAFQSGTLNLTAANLSIGPGGLLGTAVTLDTRNINVTNSTIIQPTGKLIFAGGHFSSGSTTLNGEIQINAGATANFNGIIAGSGSITGAGNKLFKNGSSIAIGAIDASGFSAVETGAVLTAGRIREQSLTVNGNANIAPGGTNASVINTLSIVTGRLNLTDNMLIINYTGSSPLGQIASLIQSGFAGGAWNGVGINSTAAAVTPGRAVGFAEAFEIGSPATFAGEPIDNTSLLIRFTRAGDADLSGTVSLDDFTALAAAFGSPGRWRQGDFNYDNQVNLNDFTLLAANFGLSIADAPTADRSSVPEPATLGAFALAATTLLRRRNL